jgi:hypothetical protein
MKLFQLILFGGLCAFFLQFAEKNEGRAVAIVSASILWGISYAWFWLANWWRYR